PCVEIVGRGDLVLALPGMQVDAIADDQRRRMSNANRNFPTLLQLIGPRVRSGKTGYDAVSVGASPSRPILREDELREKEKESEGQCSLRNRAINHKLMNLP